MVQILQKLRRDDFYRSADGNDRRRADHAGG